MSSTPLGTVDSKVAKTETIPLLGDLTFPVRMAGDKPINTQCQEM